MHPAIITRIKAETKAFWQMIEAGEEPAPDYGKDAALIEQLFARPEEIEIDLSSDNALPEGVAEYQTLGKSIAEIAERGRPAPIANLKDGQRRTRGRTRARSPPRHEAQSLRGAESTYRAIKFEEDAP